MYRYEARIFNFLANRCAMPHARDLTQEALNTAFNLARRLGIRVDNPVEKALAIKTMIIQSSQKECFLPEQISLLLQHSSEEWKTVTLVGCYTGARLGDCARMKWANVDFEKSH